MILTFSGEKKKYALFLPDSYFLAGIVYRPGRRLKNCIPPLPVSFIFQSSIGKPILLPYNGHSLIAGFMACSFQIDYVEVFDGSEERLAGLSRRDDGRADW